MKAASLCTGYGGLDLAVDAVLGTELVWCSDIDKHASTVIAERFPGVPNFDDLTLIGWNEMEPVDVLTAGYPCQPFSIAGQRRGTDDDRHLWSYIRDAVRVLRPGLVVLENVAGHLSLGLDSVLADLASLGFDAEWTVVRASDVGACHRRERVFIAAYPQHDGRDGGAVGRGAGQGAHRSATAHADADGSARLASGSSGEAVPERGEIERPGRRGGVAWGDYEPAIRRHETALGRPAPAPTDEKGRLSARFVEWMMMLPAGWVTDLLPRNPALKALGNGVVPPQAAHALRLLLSRLDLSERAA